MLRRLLPTIAGVLLALIGAGLVRTWPRAGVALGTVASTFALVKSYDFNVPAARALAVLGSAAAAAAVWIATGGPTLAVGLFAASLAVVGWPFFIVGLPAGGMATMGSFALGIGALTVIAAWPTGWWALALVPTATVATIWFVHGLKDHAELAGKTLPGQVRLKLDQPMPPFRLPARGGGDFELAREAGRPLIICYLRGDWCPACQVLMRMFRREASRLRELGIKLVAISPTPPPDADGFARDLGLDYVVLIDEHAKTAAAWGLLQRSQRNGEGVPLPVSLFVDGSGILRFITNPHDVAPLRDEERLMELAEGSRR